MGSIVEMSDPPASSQTVASDALDRETLVVAAVVLLGAIMSILDTTVVNVAIDRLAIDFHSPLTTRIRNSPSADRVACMNWL